jgi:hypothetical protein
MFTNFVINLFVFCVLCIYTLITDGLQMGAGGGQTNSDCTGMASDATLERISADHSIGAAECCHAREITAI